MKVLIAGATGAIGSLLLKELIHDKRYNPILIVARKESASHLDKVIEIRVKSLSDLEGFSTSSGTQLREIFNNIDVLFCCLGTTMKTAGSKEAFKKVDYEGVKILSNLAEKFKVKHFILISAARANKNSKVFYNQVKGEAEEELLLHNIPQITIFRPGLLLTERKEFRLGEYIAIKSVQFLTKFLPRPLISSISTEGSALVKCMIEHSLKNQLEKIIIEAKNIT